MQTTGEGTKLKVLFLCTGNSCRSQMAEGWARALRGDLIEPYSAGVATHGLNPNAVRVMAEAGVDISAHRSKHVDELKEVPLDCVVTAVEYGHGKRRGVLSDYTFAVWDGEPGEEGARLVNVGKAFTGLTDAEIAEYTEVFLKLSRGTDGRVHVVEPKVVIEIACDQIQRSGRHGSGFALRFPRIKRVRVDKQIEDADRLARVREVYESQGNFAKGKKAEEEEQPGLFDGR